MAARRSSVAATAAACILAACILAVPAAALLTPAQQAEWASYAKSMRAVGAKGKAAPLTGVVSHQYSTPLEAVQSSNVYTGGNGRLRRVVADLQAGKPVKVVAIGGVATNGSDASAPGRNDYFAQYVGFLVRAFPNAQITPVRASAGLAPSAVVVGCLDRFLPKNADLVILEMTANDGLTMDTSITSAVQPRAYEILVRKILGQPRKPAIIMTQTIPAGMGNATRAFYLTPESPAYASVSGYYNVPYVSMRNAIWPSGRLTAAGLMSSPAVDAMDGSTPFDQGHSALVDALAFITQRTAMDLQLLPFGVWDTKQIDTDVPSKNMFMGADAQVASIRQAACSWVKNASVSTTGGCPSAIGQMCGLDYSSWPAIKEGYAKTVSEVFEDDGSGPSKRMAALVGGIVGGVVGGLALIAGLIAAAIIRQKRRAAAEEAAYNAKMAERSAGALPIQASAGDASAAPVAAANSS